MDPISIAMMAVGGLTKLGSTIAARKQGKRMRKEGESMLKEAAQRESMLETPTMEVPGSVDKYIDLARTQARQELPGAAQMRRDIAQTTAGTLSAARQGAQGADYMAAVLGAAQNRRRALSEMGIAAAQYTAGKQSEYGQAIASRAPWEQQQFEMNEFLPWQMEMNRIQDLQNVGRQMKYGGGDIQAAAGIQGANMLNQGMWGMRQNPYIWGPMQDWMSGWGSPSATGSVGAGGGIGATGGASAGIGL
jgi:hypothetical protein